MHMHQSCKLSKSLILCLRSSIIAYCNSTRDYMVPSVWGPVPKGEDPYAPPTNAGCCLVM